MYKRRLQMEGYICVAWCLVIATSHMRGATANCSESLCSHIRSMSRHCEDGGSTILDGRVGKSGPKGERGENGKNAEVDYSVIDNMLRTRIDATKAYVDRKIANCTRSLQLYERKIEELELAFESLTKKDCAAIRLLDAEAQSGVFNIIARGRQIKVFCDLATDGGGWTVFQRRMDGSEDFFRGWNDYVQGFGNLTGEFWLGLDAINRLTSNRKYELRVDMEAWDGERRYAEYSSFSVGAATSNYSLSISGYSGTASDSMTRENGRAFSTKDRDSSDVACASLYKGAWWYGRCHEANLNGLYSKTGSKSAYGVGINWRNWKGYHYSLKFVEMKIRPKSL